MSEHSHSHNDPTPSDDGVKRRDFLVLSAQAMGGLGAAGLLWPFVDSMNPAADVLAMASTEVDVSSLQAGQEIRVMWRGKPVFIRNRTEKEIEEARKDDPNGENGGSTLPDPQKDSERVKEGKEQWIVMLGVCTHLGCVPLGNNAGEYNGWFCPCHGSHYDTSGRIRKGPAPTNLTVPDYEFLTDTKIKIG